MMRSFILVLVLFCAALAAPDLWADKVAPTSRAITGSYDSNWGPVHLKQDKTRITGTYECCGGGTITGTRDGDLITYEWRQSGTSGRGVWRILDGGARLEGTWGTGKSATSGGPWNLTRLTAEIAR